MVRINAIVMGSFQINKPNCLLLILFILLSTGMSYGQDIVIGMNQTEEVTTNTTWSTVTIKNGGSLIVRSGDTLTIGSPGNPYDLLVADFQNGSSVLVETGAVLIVYGTLNNSNNSDGIIINGELIVHGNFTGGSGSTITGTGTMDADGSISTTGSGAVFGSTDECTTGPCSGNDLCGLTNALTSGNQAICSGSSILITGDIPTGGSGGYTYLWESSTTSAGAGFASAAGTNNAKDYTTENLIDTTWFRRKVFSGTCTDVSEPVQIRVISGTPGTWIGITSSDWATASNWCGGVPAATVDVTIPSGTAFSPLVSSAAACRNLTIESGAILEIGGVNLLEVKGNFSNAGTFTANSGTISFTGLAAQTISGTNNFNNLIINNLSGVTISSGAQTINGTLTLAAGTLNTNGNLYVDFNNNGNIAGTCVGTISGDVTYLRNIPAGWHYISNPAGTGTLEHFNDDMPYIINGKARYYWYNEAFLSTNIEGGWTSIKSTSYSLGNMRGICPYFSGAVSLDVTGIYDHSATYSSGFLPYNSSGVGASDGWHLIGNPYPSTLDWESAIGWTKTNINNAIYFWDPVTEMNKSYISGASTNEGTQYIPAMQAVFVKALPGGAVLSVNNDARTVSSQSFFKKSFNQDIVKIKVSSGGFSDESIVRFLAEATSDFDPSFDAYKFVNGALNPSLYSLLSKDMYSVNSLPPVSHDLIVPLHFNAGFDGSYSLSFDIPSGFSPDLEILLEDLKTGEIINVTYQPAYSFSASSSDPSGRFQLIFKKPTVTSASAKSLTQFRVFNTGEKIFINYSEDAGTPVQVLLINSLGEIVKSDLLPSVSSHFLFVDKGQFETGIYLVKIISGKEIQSEQVFISR